MLKLRYLFENYDLAKSVLLENWGYDEDSIDEMLSCFRISSNAIYPYKRNGSSYILRLSPTDEKLSCNMYGEQEFIEYLHENGYPAHVATPANNGEKVLKLATKLGEYYAVSYRHIGGKRVDRTDMSDDIMFACGESLAKLHNLSSKYVPTVKKWSYADALDWMEVDLIANAAPEISLREVRSVRSELAKLPMDNETYGLVHYDFEPDNLFYDQETRECRVIDFDDGMYHWFALDLAQSLDAIAEEIEDNTDDENEAKLRVRSACDSFIAGYSSLRPYNEKTRALFPLMSRFINIFGYTRLLHCVSDVTETNPDWVCELREKLTNSLRAKEALMQK